MIPALSYFIVMEEDFETAQAVEVIEAALAPPEVPPECWNAEKPDPERCMAAVRAMSRG